MIFGVAHFSTIQIFNPQESFVPCINLNMLVDYSSWHRLIFTWKLAFLWSSNAGTEDGCQAVSRGHSKHSDTWANTLASSDLWKLTHALSMWTRLSCWLAPSPHTSWTTKNKNMPLSSFVRQWQSNLTLCLMISDIVVGDQTSLVPKKCSKLCLEILFRRLIIPFPSQERITKSDIDLR